MRKIHILELYTEGNLGLEKIAYRLVKEGWPFKDRKGIPRPINRDDIRRIVANWPEYGGIVMDRKAKDRSGYEQCNIDEISFKSERAVFPIKLLRSVAEVRHQRARKPIDHGVKRISYPYPLSAITYCAHCEQQAQEYNDVRLRSALSGTNMNGTRRYRHASGIKCGCSNRSVTCDILEDEFVRLIEVLTIRPEAVDLMKEFAIQAQNLSSVPTKEQQEHQKIEAIALCRRRIDAAVTLFGDGMIDKREYRRRVEENEREIAHWEARTTETEKLGFELAMCVGAVRSIARTWRTSGAEDRQGMARNLFEELVFDLDAQRIVGFKLKEWADRFLVVRAALLEDETKHAPNGQGLKRELPHRGLEATSIHMLPTYCVYMALEIYKGSRPPAHPVKNSTPRKSQRNRQICDLYVQGATISDLARQFSVSQQRIHQIIQNRRK